MPVSAVVISPGPVIARSSSRGVAAGHWRSGPKPGRSRPRPRRRRRPVCECKRHVTEKPLADLRKGGIIEQISRGQGRGRRGRIGDHRGRPDRRARRRGAICAPGPAGCRGDGAGGAGGGAGDRRRGGRGLDPVARECARRGAGAGGGGAGGAAGGAAADEEDRFAAEGQHRRRACRLRPMPVRGAAGDPGFRPRRHRREAFGFRPGGADRRRRGAGRDRRPRRNPRHATTGRSPGGTRRRAGQAVLVGARGLAQALAGAAGRGGEAGGAAGRWRRRC